MIYSATLTKTGQITIPKSVREMLGVKPGQKVIFEQKRDAVTIEKSKTVEEISAEIHALVPDYVKEKARKNAGKTTGQMREEWLKSDGAKKYYEERLRGTL